MNVRQLITHLMSMDMDADAEVMVEARALALPVISITPGNFVGNQEPYVIVNGTEVWGLDHGVHEIK